MQVGDVIRVADLSLPQGITSPLDPDTAVVTAIGGAAPEAVEGEEAAEAEAEGAEAAAEGEGEATAEGGEAAEG